MPTEKIELLRNILLRRDTKSAEFPILVCGYYRCEIIIGGAKLDVTEIGRPHPAASDDGYFFELFGTSIHLSVEPSAERPGIPVDDDGSMLIALTGIEEATPTFDHFYRRMLSAGGVLVPTRGSF